MRGECRAMSRTHPLSELDLERELLRKSVSLMGADRHRCRDCPSFSGLRSSNESPRAHALRNRKIHSNSLLPRAWATSRPMIKGLIVSEAGDYGAITGLRAPDGHLRRATFAIMTAMRGLRETQPVAPTLRVQQ